MRIYKPRPPVERLCVVCAQPFVARRRDKVHCSERCYQRAYQRRRRALNRQALWWWALDNADAEGNVELIFETEIAAAAGWPEKQSEAWVLALVWEANGWMIGRHDAPVAPQDARQPS